nr:hypothetical protein CFP56_22709 [Quercus suber]
MITMMMMMVKPLLFLLLCSLLHPIAATADNLVPERREVYDNGRIIDITHKYTPETPSGGDSENGVGQFLRLRDSMKNGSLYNGSELRKLFVHAGTHVDAPGHMFDHYFDAGFDIDTLDLGVLNGTT